MGMKEREGIPVVEGVPDEEGVPVQGILEDIEGVLEEERVPEVEVVPEMTSPEAEGIPKEVKVPVQGIPGDVEGVPEVEVVPERTPDSSDVVFVSEEVVPIAGEGIIPMDEERTRAINVLERVVGKRPKVPSQYAVSPFTVEVKRRRFVDGTHPNLFKEVDHAKWKAFETEWRVIKPGASCTIAQKTISNFYKWYYDITTSRAWLTVNHIDLAMDLLRDRAERYPKSFNIPDRLILNTEFIRAVDIEYQSFQAMGNEYTVPAYMMEWVVEMWPNVGGKPWEGCTHMYMPVCVNHHYIAVKIVFADSTMYVYDPDHLSLTQGQLERNLESVSVIIPIMARRANITVQDRLATVRNTTTTRQRILGDCGMFVIKYIEFLSVA
ncbi:uncharacterized protein LOC111368276 [Olea europaea var. sylvestris]|uniref:uncharacterized protein LOC111368276 n=1 Tax=Olea europaea var. sylvestris TaxID=158386 RepID=UPI000C1CE1B2|nr:uncharacterized protein LOC111368276 [Olea europaea var. sylvestris]